MRRTLGTLLEGFLVSIGSLEPEPEEVSNFRVLCRIGRWRFNGLCQPAD